MQQKIIRIGSSFGITVSPLILQKLGWRQGTKIELVVDEKTGSLRVLKNQDDKRVKSKVVSTKKTPAKKSSTSRTRR